MNLRQFKDAIQEMPNRKPGTRKLFNYINTVLCKGQADAPIPDAVTQFVLLEGGARKKAKPSRRDEHSDTYLLSQRKTRMATHFKRCSEESYGQTIGICYFTSVIDSITRQPGLLKWLSPDMLQWMRKVLQNPIMSRKHMRGEEEIERIQKINSVMYILLPYGVKAAYDNLSNKDTKNITLDDEAVYYFKKDYGKKKAREYIIDNTDDDMKKTEIQSGNHLNLKMAILASNPDVCVEYVDLKQLKAIDTLLYEVKVVDIDGEFSQNHKEGTFEFEYPINKDKINIGRWFKLIQSGKNKGMYKHSLSGSKTYKCIIRVLGYLNKRCLTPMNLRSIAMKKNNGLVVPFNSTNKFLQKNVLQFISKASFENKENKRIRKLIKKYDIQQMGDFIRKILKMGDKTLTGYAKKFYNAYRSKKKINPKILVILRLINGLNIIPYTDVLLEQFSQFFPNVHDFDSTFVASLSVRRIRLNKDHSAHAIAFERCSNEIRFLTWGQSSSEFEMRSGEKKLSSSDAYIRRIVLTFPVAEIKTTDSKKPKTPTQTRYNLRKRKKSSS